MDVAVDEYAARELGVGDEETRGVVSVGVDGLVGVVCVLVGNGGVAYLSQVCERRIVGRPMSPLRVML